MDNDKATMVSLVLTIIENRIGEQVPTDCFLYRLVEVFAETVIGIADHYNAQKERGRQ